MINFITKPVWFLSVSLMILGVACGSAAAPEIIEREVVKEVQVEVIKEVEVEKQVEKVVETEVEKLVVATPTPAPTPIGGYKTVDQFNIMVTTQGNEIWDSKYDQAESNTYVRLAQSWLIGGQMKDGSLVLSSDTGIASKWEIVDDGLGWEFTIKEGIKFHNGDELNVDDVDFTFNFAISDESASVSKVRVARAISDMSVTGPDTFKITTFDPLGNLGVALSEIDNLTMGTVTNKDYWMSLPEGEKVENCTPEEVCSRAAAFQQNPSPGHIGPFSVTGHLYSEEIRYERFPDYFAMEHRTYPFNSVSLRLVPELSTRVAALQAGTADIIEADLTVIDQVQKGNGQIVYAPEAVHIWINANGCDRELDNDSNPIMCNDERVRFALDYAIDKTLIQQLYGGEKAFEIAGYQGIASPSGLGYEENIAPLPFDAAKAQQLLADAGYPGGEGFNGGRTLMIHTWVGAGAPLTVEVSELICSMWQQNLGIDCEVSVGEEVSTKKIQYAGEIAGQYVVRTNENTFDGGRRMMGRYAEGGYICSDPELAEKYIMPALATAGDLSVRHDAYNKALKAVFDKHYDFTPGYLNQPYGVSSRVTSWTPWPLQPYPSALWDVRFE